MWRALLASVVLAAAAPAAADEWSIEFGGTDAEPSPFGAPGQWGGADEPASPLGGFTPRAAGPGAPEAQVDELARAGGARRDAFDVTLGYRDTFGISGQAGFGWDGTEADPRVGAPEEKRYGLGGRLGYGGVSVRGSFAAPEEAPLDLGDSYDAGLSYAAGPWGVSLSYFSGETLEVDDSADGYRAALDYDIGPGVTGSLVGAYSELDDERPDGENIDFFYIATGVKLNF